MCTWQSYRFFAKKRALPRGARITGIPPYKIRCPSPGGANSPGNNPIFVTAFLRPYAPNAIQTTAMSQNYDVMILGAGPAGSSCALHLRSAGLKVGLLDKHTFPRDKVCGDAIPGRAIRCLQSIFPDLPAALDGFQEKLLTHRRVCYFNKKQI